MRREPANEAVSVEGLIRLDVVVTDQAGKAVEGLKRTDFKVMENGSPQNIVAFWAASQAPARGDDALSVILLLDTIDQRTEVKEQEQQEAAEFLRQNAGRLLQPVTIYSLEPTGFFLTTGPSTDGESLARDVIADLKAETYFVPREKSRRGDPRGDESFDTFPALTGLKALATIATLEVSRPGRKLLFWIGPSLSDRGTGAIAKNGQKLLRYPPQSLAAGVGAPVSDGGYSLSGKDDDRNRRDVFGKVRWFSALLRQARVIVDCLATDKDNEPASDWQPFLNSALSLETASWMDLYKKVLAVQSGGQVLPFSRSRVAQMNDAIKADAIDYSLTFDPLPAREEQYHTLNVALGQSNLTARTTTGYYDEPYYDDPPDPAIRRVTAAQLAILLNSPASQGRSIPPVALTERLGPTRIHELGRAGVRPGGESLEAIADESAFLEPPSSEVLADPPPDRAEQGRILSAAGDYLQTAVAKLPDFYANRTVDSYLGAPLQKVKEAKDMVVYRHGDEVLVNNKLQPVGGDSQPLETRGTFGPILNVVENAFTDRSSVVWKRWEKSAYGRLAVFGYAYPGKPMVSLVGCCFPNGAGHPQTRISAESHGEITIDPQNGAILRIQVQNDLAGFVPAKRSDIEVSYGPVEIQGKTFIVPLQGVSIWRGRTVNMLTQWDTLGFAAWGPYETLMNVFTFEHYHNFRSSARILPGYTP